MIQKLISNEKKFFINDLKLIKKKYLNSRTEKMCLLWIKFWFKVMQNQISTFKLI